MSMTVVSMTAPAVAVAMNMRMTVSITMSAVPAAGVGVAMNMGMVVRLHMSRDERLVSMSQGHAGDYANRDRHCVVVAGPRRWRPQHPNENRNEQE